MLPTKTKLLCDRRINNRQSRCDFGKRTNRESGIQKNT